MNPKMNATVTPPAEKHEIKKVGRDRFSPGLYQLDLSALKDLPLKINGVPSTFAEAYYKLADAKIRKMPDGWSIRVDKYVTDAGDIDLEAEWTGLSKMKMLIDLVRQDIDPFTVMWFYYDHDWSRDADECDIFFAVHSDKITLESCRFYSYEPLMLKKVDEDKEPVWQHRSYFDEAVAVYYYRKFYTETFTGKLMVLRPDQPILHFYERPSTRDATRDVTFVTVIKAYRLLWVAVALLVAIAFPATKAFMGIVAAALFLDVLRHWFVTRKVGTE